MSRRGSDPEVRAAGGVIWRRGADGVEVLLVHRPKYGDWTFAKGKLERGESYREAARREVLEETGLHVSFGDELEPTRYIDGKGRDKLVRYWTMTVERGAFEPNDEVDEIRWIPVGRAAARLTYERDLPLLESFDRWLLTSPER